MIPCKLVHDTGTMVRFTTSQLNLLPGETKDIRLILPGGKSVEARFLRNRANPNISGIEVVSFIKERIDYGEREDIILEQVTPELWIVHLIEKALEIASEAKVPASHVRRASFITADINKLLRIADREHEIGRRIGTYERVLRPIALRRLLIDAVGASCMINDCNACSRFDVECGYGSGSFIIEVHHIEHIAHTIDHHPKNLCVLCANHHRFIHHSGSWQIHHDSANVVFKRGMRELVAIRPIEIFS